MGLEMKFVWEHLYLVVMSSIFTIIIGLLLGVISYLVEPLSSIILKIVDIFQTIPVLAVLGLAMIAFGASSGTVIFGLVIYSLLPVVRNTYVGLSDVDPGIKEAAKGMGMTKMQRLFLVELQLAFPMIFTGIRIAVVTSIGTAVFGAFVGGGGLGATINKAILIQDMNTLLQSTLALMIMAVIFDFGMAYVEDKLKSKNA